MVANITLTGNEILYVVGQDQTGAPAAIQFPITTAQLTSIDKPIYGTNTATASSTLTVANMEGAATGNTVPDTVILAMTGTLAAAATATTPTAVALIAGIPGVILNNSYIFRFINASTGAFAWTVAGGTGVTVTGTATVAQNTWREFIVSFPTATTVGLQSIGTGTYS